MPTRPRIITDVPRLAEAPPSQPAPVIPTAPRVEPPPKQTASAPVAVEAPVQSAVVLAPVIPEPEASEPIEEPAPPTPQLEPLLFEIAWEVCWQLGGIYTVLRSKAPAMLQRWGSDIV